MFLFTLKSKEIAILIGKKNKGTSKKKKKKNLILENNVNSKKRILEYY